MDVLTHPIWPKSKLPPRTLAAINNQHGEIRREYLAELIETYELKVSQLVPLSREIMEKWSRNQGEHLKKCAAELHHMMELETRGITEWDGREYFDNTRDADTVRCGSVSRRVGQSRAATDY